MEGSPAWCGQAPHRRKIHLAVDETQKDVIGIEITTADWGDSEVLPALLAQLDGELTQVSADGAYDTEKVPSQHCRTRRQASIPPERRRAPMGDDHPRERIRRRLPSAGATAGKTTAAITGAALPRP